MIPRLDLTALEAHDPKERAQLRRAAEEIGFMTLCSTGIPAARMERLFRMYRRFFAQPRAVKASVDMARTGSNRGWGAPQSEHVDQSANPDYKEVFDCGHTLPENDPLSAIPVYGPNQWPAQPEGFETEVETYFAEAMTLARRVLAQVVLAIEADSAHFNGAFQRPMALLRGNYYPTRPDWAGARDFGIAEHTDYGCLTLLATGGAPGLEVRMRDGTWAEVTAPHGEFIINFGEMLEIWTEGKVAATPHRVVGTAAERLSVPLFFNPSHVTNVAPKGAPPVQAGEHLARRFGETYVHLMEKDS